MEQKFQQRLEEMENKHKESLAQMDWENKQKLNDMKKLQKVILDQREQELAEKSQESLEQRKTELKRDSALELKKLIEKQQESNSREHKELELKHQDVLKERLDDIEKENLKKLAEMEAKHQEMLDRRLATFLEEKSEFKQDKEDFRREREAFYKEKDEYQKTRDQLLISNTKMKTEMEICPLSKHEKQFVLPESHWSQITWQQAANKDIEVSGFAFVDDTTWLARSQADMQETLDIAQSFFSLHDIEINTKKTFLVILNSPADQNSILFGNPRTEIVALPATESTRILGVWISSKGGTRDVLPIVRKEMDPLVEVLSRKVITDKQCVYVLNNILLTRILYRCTLHILTPKELRKITSKCRNLVKQKAALPRDTPNSIIHHPRFYGLRQLQDLQAEDQISSLYYRLNDPTIVGDLTRARLLALQFQHRILSCPLAQPALLTSPPPNNLIGDIICLMKERGVSFSTNDILVPSSDTLTRQCTPQLEEPQMVPVDGNNPSRPISRPQSSDIALLGPEENPIVGFDQEGSSIPTVVPFGESLTLTSTTLDLTEQPYHGISMTNSSSLITPVITAHSVPDSIDSNTPVTSIPSSLSIFPVSSDFLDVGLLPAAADVMSVFPQPPPSAATTPSTQVMNPTLYLTPIQALFDKTEFKKFRHQLCDKGIWHLEQLTNSANTHLCTWDVAKARLRCRSRVPMWYTALRRNICVTEPDNFIQVSFVNDNQMSPTHLTIDNDKLTRLK
ncbi:hypothetical protein BGZ80_001248, partial [Entomortierella chlamydospora]